jgi:hypothetical protein
MTEPIKIAILNDELVVAGIAGCRTATRGVKVVEVVVDRNRRSRGRHRCVRHVRSRRRRRRPHLGIIANPRIGHVVIYTTSRRDATRQPPRVGCVGCLSKSLSAIDLVRSLNACTVGEVTIAMRSSRGPSDFA